MFQGKVGDLGNLAFWMSWTPWQSVQTATFVSPFFSSRPCMLVSYWLSWSTRRLGL